MRYSSTERDNPLKTATELDKALANETNHTKFLTMYHQINEGILERAMDYVDNQNKITKRNLCNIKYEIRKITSSTRRIQNQPETRVKLRLLKGTHKLLILQQQARLEQKLFTQITVTKDMASRRFYESMWQYKKAKRMINRVS